jgi:hypothetical protein
MYPPALTNRCQMIGNRLTSASLNRFKCEGNSLSAADAQSDYAAFQAVALHGMQKSRGQHRPGRANRMAVCNCAAFHIDNVLRKTEVLGHGNGDGRKRLINFDALDVGSFPASARLTLRCRRCGRSRHSFAHGSPRSRNHAVYGACELECAIEPMGGPHFCSGLNARYATTF